VVESHAIGMDGVRVHGLHFLHLGRHLLLVQAWPHGQRGPVRLADRVVWMGGMGDDSPPSCA